MSLSGKAVLVTGATGFLGGALSRRLAAEGAHVRALARRSNRDRHMRHIDHIEIVQGDVTNIGRMHEVIEGCDYVFNAAAAMGGRLEAQHRVNVIGVRNIMIAAARAGVRRVVHVSSVAIYGFNHTGNITEDLPLQARKDPYNVTKAEGEAILREVGKEHDLSYSIIRPGLIYGPGGGMWTRTMFRLARQKPTIFIGDGSGSVYPIHVDDVVDMMLLLATHPAADGEAFNCTPDPSPSWREFLGSYSRLAGHDSWLGLPVWLAQTKAPLIEFILTLRGEPKELPALLAHSQRTVTYKTTKARDLLGWQPTIDLQTGIESCVPYLRETGLLK